MRTSPVVPAAQARLGAISTPLIGRALVSYYLFGSPLFFVADVLFGVSIRAAFLDNEPMLRFLYYALVFVCGLVAARRPEWSGIVGLLESGANIAMLVFGVMLTYYAAVETVAAEGPVGSPFGGTWILNLILSALVLTVSYVGHQNFCGFRRNTSRRPETR